MQEPVWGEQKHIYQDEFSNINDLDLFSFKYRTERCCVDWGSQRFSLGGWSPTTFPLFFFPRYSGIQRVGRREAS
jgi:hypothetical protein